jgi:hypothetical protein
MPSYDELLSANRMLNGIVGVHADTYRAASHLLEVLNMVGAKNAPVFTLNDSDHDDEHLAIIRHAVINLAATIEGSELPPLALPDRITH